ncbi:LAFA_0D03796g1_1 [Lachancea sp. 'fantastica']|nr:LAFA_0D03796g1_1 [Lachancea sp. 'fantastica']
MYVPVMTLCGHNYCYECISSWIVSNNASELTCPQCRTTLDQPPIVNSALQDLLSAVIDRQNDPNSSIERARTQSVKLHKEDLAAGSLYNNVFENTALAVVDDDDGVARCSSCHWEAEGDTCPHCGARLRNRPQDYDDSDHEGYLTDSPEPRGTRLPTGTSRHSWSSDNDSGHSVDSDADNSGSDDDQRPIGSARDILNRVNASGRTHLLSDGSEHDSDLDSFIVDEAEEDDMSRESSDSSSSARIIPRAVNFENLDSDEANQDEMSRRGSDSSSSGRITTRPFNNEDFDSDEDDEDLERDSDFWEHNEEEGHVSGDSLDDINGADRKIKKRRFQVIDDSDED